MPRDVPVGNGQILVNFDLGYHVTGVFFPHVGQENQTEGHVCRFGVWRDGMMAWFSEGGWEDLVVGYEPDTLVTQVSARHQGLGLVIHFTDAVDFNENVLVRAIRFEPLPGREAGEVRVFFHFDAHMGEQDVGQSAYYDPKTRAIIHFKEDRYCLLGGMDDRREGLFEYAIGIKEVGGLEGTWRDAEDGHLEGNPVAQGSVDTTSSLVTTSSGTVHFWLTLGKSYQEVTMLDSLIRDKTPEVLTQRTRDYWHLWVMPQQVYPGDLPDSIMSLVRRSLLTIRTQIDRDGAILAATDWDIVRFGRDTYDYVWPRDGALVADAMDRWGLWSSIHRFYSFCSRVLQPGGYFLHKYNPDGTPGSTWHARIMGGHEVLPIQEDETALVLQMLWRHFERHRQVEIVAPMYRHFIIAAADFLVSYRDPVTHLPLPSHDLWEERWGVLTFTAATVWAGLMAGAHFARAFGEVGQAERYEQAAREVREAVTVHLFDRETNRFARMAEWDLENQCIAGLDLTPDASLFGIIDTGMFEPDDPKLVSTYEQLEKLLWVKTDVGGMARYTNDPYQRVPADPETVPGNPWFICTLWLCEWRIARAKSLADLAAAKELLVWVKKHALPSGIMAEQINPFTHEPLSVSPLTWSHAAFVATVHKYLERHKALAKAGVAVAATS